MHPLRPKRGRVVNHEAPIWEPLIALAPDGLGDFMWMHEVELEDGTRLHAYKHYETRRYLHLDHGDRAFVFVWDEDRLEDEDALYEEVDPQWLLELVLAGPDERAILLRQNVTAEFKRLRWARSATKHRVSRKRIRQAIENCVLVLEEEPPSDHPTAADKRLVLLGDDAEGIPLEVIAVEPASGSLYVIHAMKLRERFKAEYEEVGSCQR
jgi:hypothetical protein